MYHLRRRAPSVVTLAAILAGAALIPATAKAATAVFGSVVAIGGTPSDIATQFPTEVLTPAPGVKYSSWLNDVVPMVSLVFTR